MLKCVTQTLSPKTNEITVNSEGGNAEVALALAVILEKLPPFSLYVENECNSSCANYLIPVASRLIVEPKAIILLHGGIDPAYTSKQYENTVEEAIKHGLTHQSAIEKAEIVKSHYTKIEQEQTALVGRHRIGLGWLLYRTAENPKTVDALDGAFGKVKGEMHFVIVEEDFIRSCLPNLDIAPFQANLEHHWFGNNSRLKHLERLGAARSNQLRCISNN